MKKAFFIVFLVSVSILAQSGTVDITELTRANDCLHMYTTVCVFDSLGYYVPELGVEDFSFTEKGYPLEPPELELLNECEGGYYCDIAILLDLSGSMDEDVDVFHAALSVFAAGLTGLDYRICMSVYDGCPEQSGAIRRLVHTDFSVAGPCSIGTDYWATSELEFSKLFNAVQMYYDGPSGSGTEDQFGALWWAVDTLDWRPECKKAVVLFTDERVTSSMFCDPRFTADLASFIEIKNYCVEESVSFYAVTPPPFDIMGYTGYSSLACSTGGIWSNLYDTAYTAMICSLVTAIANIRCCYEFRYMSSVYCSDSLVNLTTYVNTDSCFYGFDDTQYVSYCPPELERIIPYPCGGITSCADQEIIEILTNPNTGMIEQTSMVFILNGDTIPDVEIDISGDSLIYRPPLEYHTGDTIVFNYAYFEDIWGCPATSAPCSFIVDIDPPYIIESYPADSTVLFEGGFPIYANIIDGFSGIDIESYPGAVSVEVNGTVLSSLSPDWSISGDTVRVYFDSLHLPPVCTVDVCISGIYDSPDYDYCPPNAMYNDCWTFFMHIADHSVNFPVVHAEPCETLMIPLLIDDLFGSEVRTARMLFQMDPEVLIPIDVITMGSILDSWGIDSIDVIDSTGTIIAYLSGSAISDSPGGELLYLKARIPCDAIGGDYTPIEIEQFTFNEGYPAVYTVGGYCIVDLLPNHFSCDIRLNPDSLPSVDDNVLTFGAMPFSTNSYDPGVDLDYIPVPGFMTNGYFSVIDESYPYIEALQRDLREISPPVTWELVINDESEGWARWTPGFLPDGEFYIDLVDMKRDSIIHFQNNDTLIIRWDIPDFSLGDIQLHSGWDLVSCPCLPSAIPPDEIFNSEFGVFRYLTNPGTYTYADCIQKGEGYWIWVASDTIVNIAGCPVESYYRHIYPGWNLIGAPCMRTSLTRVATDPPGLIIGDVFKWNGTAYTAADSLIPGEGYWLLSSDEGYLQVPSARSSRADRPPSANWIATIHSPVTGESVEFGFSKDCNEGLSHGDIAFVPPAPNNHSHEFYLKCDDVKLKRDLSPHAEWNLVVENEMTLEFDLPWNVMVQIDGTQYAGNVNITMPAGEHRINSNIVVPGDFDILACVPNPFNSRTDIVVNLPDDGYLRMGIYDIQGRNIYDLNEYYYAGQTRIGWNGTDNSGNAVPSGIYFVNVEYLNQNKISRLILLK